jgi:hypothetical protein
LRETLNWSVYTLVAQNRKTEFIPFDPYQIIIHLGDMGFKISPAVTIANAVHVALSCRCKRNEFCFAMILIAALRWTPASAAGFETGQGCGE